MLNIFSPVPLAWKDNVWTYALVPTLAMLVWKAMRFVSGLQRNPTRLPLPPGPKGYPLIGSLLEIPTSRQWKVYNDWAKIYGDVMYFEVLGQRIMVLNSLEAAQDLFTKRSANYSDRPKFHMIVDLMKCGYLFSTIPYGSWWRRHRRSFNEHFHAGAVWKYQSIQARDTRAFLNMLLNTPADFISHIRLTLATTIMSATYGIKISGFDDPYIVNVEEILRGIAIAGIPGSFLVDMIPALKYVPTWFPGAGFKEKAKNWSIIATKVAEMPFAHVARQMEVGTASPSIAATLISELPEKDDKALFAEETKIAQGVTAIAYVAGADTTISTIQSFFLAMALYPDVQKKAQAELDAVIGPNRLPELSDQPSLPYVNALVKETMRWQAVLPLAIPHVSSEDDVYNGYFIPKGTIIFGNAWAIQHDEKVFKDPEEYRPERFLKNGQLDPTVRQADVSAFGFGRRICPGRFFSNNMLFSIVSSTLQTFDITAALDEKGVPLPLSTEMTEGLLSYPEPFKVDIKPRSRTAEFLIRNGTLGD